MDLILLLLSTAVALSIATFYRRRSYAANPRRLPLPPGPKPELFIGNVRQMPRKQRWLKFAEWKKTYGDIVHAQAFGQHLVILNSYQLASQLLGPRALYSDRPQFQFLGELMGWGRMVSLIQYGDVWKRYRKLIHPAMNKTAVRQYWPAQQKEARVLLQTLIDRPEDFMKEIRSMIGKVVMSTVYGINVESPENEYIVMAEAALETVAHVSGIGNSLLNMFPILKYTPTWFPWSQFKRNALKWRVIAEKMVEMPFADVKRKMATGKALPSFTAACLESGDAPDEIIKWTAGTMYAAGSDTTVASLTSFILAMVLYPEVQKRAQAEIDRVVGKDRLPTFEDRAEMPYMDCVVKEILRWKVVSPLAIPHRAMEVDYFQDYWIPKGTSVIPNVWAMSQDETMYKDPERFWPERFEGEAGKNIVDPHSFVFGFGRRVCTGSHFADANIFIVAASILAAFNISKPLDENGNEVDPVVSFSTGMVTHADPFKCTIKPRSATAISLIQAEG
ncbi:hypothetical protein BOTBODRAFT_39161 [Botryobasidium botryosum FD-172 SS1]|uniref:Cytochrome P450 n=1 Tax=Botryobasidium botryosum (strain FD-172 SS1) TaxID=930990 RepID=A0A067LUL4_BOTB1|nr:hypothetical protein BOTBODRAFT_39161 [Botryobasidium botryosum FD-172 SS1]